MFGNKFTKCICQLTLQDMNMDGRQDLDNMNMSEDEVQKTGDEEIDNKSSGEDANNENQHLKRKRYHRHTQQQIEAMEK